MVSLINKQLLLTAYAYLFIMEQQKAQQGGEALQLQIQASKQGAKLPNEPSSLAMPNEPESTTGNPEVVPTKPDDAGFFQPKPGSGSGGGPLYVGLQGMTDCHQALVIFDNNPEQTMAWLQELTTDPDDNSTPNYIVKTKEIRTEGINSGPLQCWRHYLLVPREQEGAMWAAINAYRPHEEKEYSCLAHFCCGCCSYNCRTYADGAFWKIAKLKGVQVSWAARFWRLWSPIAAWAKWVSIPGLVIACLGWLVNVGSCAFEQKCTSMYIWGIVTLSFAILLLLLCVPACILIRWGCEKHRMPQSESGGGEDAETIDKDNRV